MRVLYTDGGSRHNGSAAQSARMAVYDDEKRAIVVEREIGALTNNEAEYRAIHAALEYAAGQGLGPVMIRSDSQLCVEQINGRWKVKEARLLPLVLTARQSLALNGGVVEWVPRERNPAGHHLDRTTTIGGDARLSDADR